MLSPQTLVVPPLRCSGGGVWPCQGVPTVLLALGSAPQEPGAAPGWVLSPSGAGRGGLGPVTLGFLLQTSNDHLHPLAETRERDTRSQRALEQRFPHLKFQRFQVNKALLAGGVRQKKK